MRGVVAAVVLACLCLLPSLGPHTLLPEELVAVAKRLGLVDEDVVELRVGIMSARGHFEQRQALRETWVGHAKEHLSGSVDVRFVVGARACMLPLEDRASPLSCEPSGLLNPVFDQDIRAHHSAPAGLVGTHTFSGPVGMDFVTNHWVEVTELGAFDSGGDGLARAVRVSLWEVGGQQLLAQEEFSAESPGTLVGVHRYKAIPPVVLPRGMRFAIVAENYGPEEPMHNKGGQHGRADDGGGLLTFLPVSRFGLHQGEFPASEERVLQEPNQYAAGTFIYRAERRALGLVYGLPWRVGSTYAPVPIRDIDTLQLSVSSDDGLVELGSSDDFSRCDVSKPARVWTAPLQDKEEGPEARLVDVGGLSPGAHYMASLRLCHEGLKVIINVTQTREDDDVASSAGERAARAAAWKVDMDAEDKKLEEEQRQHGDLLLLPNHVDVYRSLPGKVASFHLWAAESGAAFALKTDDDCFVDLEGVLQAIEDQALHDRKKIWWGHFRNDWPVDRSGKWAEPDYTASLYPSFACGSGNVVSHDLARWIGENVAHLHSFQGEDVSLGIWLASLHPVLVKDYRWQCQGICEAGMLSSPQHDPETLRGLWHNFTSCGNACACDSGEQGTENRRSFRTARAARAGSRDGGNKGFWGARILLFVVAFLGVLLVVSGLKKNL